MSRQCCKMCRHYRSAVVGFGGEPLDDDAVCNVHRKAVDADDWCNSFSLSLWGAAKQNSEEGGVE